MAELHRVRRWRWQARASDAAAAFALRRALHERSDALEAALARAFDRVAPPAGVWRLPRLELKLAVADGRLLDDRFDAQFEEAVVEALLALRPPVAAVDRPGGLTTAAPQATSGQVVATSEAAQDALRSYLATGLLPWSWQGPEPPAALHHAARSAAAAALIDGALREALLPAGGFHARLGAMVRWLALIDSAQRSRWVEAHRPRPPLARLRSTWPVASPGDASTLEWQAAWLAWPDTAAPAPAADDRRALRRWIAQRRGASRADQHADGPPAVDGSQSRLSGDSRASPPATTAAAAYPPASAAETALPPAARPWAVPTSAEDAAQALLVPLAGLVLLHPYLPRLLAACGLVEAGAREVAEARLPRALALLHALACGPGLAAEHQLALPKLLLGREPTEPLSAALPIPSDAEQEEVDAVLAACCEHWGALRGSSSQALQLSFLQRRGLLAHADGAWQLRLQGEAFDMLLGLLPWSIGIVRLPWMAEPLFVEWPTP